MSSVPRKKTRRNLYNQLGETLEECRDKKSLISTTTNSKKPGTPKTTNIFYVNDFQNEEVRRLHRKHRIF